MGGGWVATQEGRPWIRRSPLKRPPEGARDAFVTRDVLELTTAEAAEALGVSKPSVKMALMRARRRLKRALAEAEGVG